MRLIPSWLYSKTDITLTWLSNSMITKLIVFPDFEIFKFCLHIGFITGMKLIHTTSIYFLAHQLIMTAGLLYKPHPRSSSVNMDLISIRYYMYIMSIIFDRRYILYVYMI